MSRHSPDAWPSLPLEGWSDTYATLHLWTQIVGKIRLTLTPPLNHCWNVTLYVTARGLTTSPMPYGDRSFQIDFDFLGDVLRLEDSAGAIGEVPLAPQPVAEFYRRLWRELERLDLRVRIHTTPNEVADPIPFERDERHAAYDAGAARRFWRILGESERVFQRFRARFVGKCSPVHFFWGAPDLAVTRFSGKPAPVHPGGVPGLPDRVTRDAYSHAVSSCGFWAGGGPIAYPAFYSYAYPEPEGFASSPVAPGAAFYSTDLHEFILPYDAVRTADAPEERLLEFLQSTYEAAANRGGWDRAALERS